jgi:clan AA aspartic protease
MPRVLLEVLTPDQSVSIEFTVDTAFDGFLALPLSTLARLGARFISESPVSLADGRVINAAVCEISVLWDGDKRTIDVIAPSDYGNPLLGVELLADNLVTLDMTDGGEVTIESR